VAYLTLVGAVLLIGITMTAVVLIIVAGTGTIGDVNEDNKAEVAGQTFAQTDEGSRRSHARIETAVERSNFPSR